MQQEFKNLFEDDLSIKHKVHEILLQPGNDNILTQLLLLLIKKKENEPITHSYFQDGLLAPKINTYLKSEKIHGLSLPAIETKIANHFYEHFKEFGYKNGLDTFEKIHYLKLSLAKSFLTESFKEEMGGTAGSAIPKGAVATEEALAEFLSSLVVEAGPINKNDETRALELIVKGILDGEQLIFQVDPVLGEIIVTLTDNLLQQLSTYNHFLQGNTLNLSVLLKKANLSHFNLPESEQRKYSDYISARSSEDALKLDVMIKMLPKLPSFFRDIEPSLLIALNAYTKGFNHNRLLRSFELNEVDASKFENLLVSSCFASLALSQLSLHYANHVRTALAKLPQNPLSKEVLRRLVSEGKITQEDADTLERYRVNRRLVRKDEMKWLRSRLLTEPVPYADAGFVSTSDGVACLHPNPNLFFANGSHLPPIKAVSDFGESENEVLIAPGVQLVIQGGKMAIVNSPMLEPRISTSIDLAVRYAYKTHLTQKFKDVRDFVSMNSKVIERPNHGLAHTMRQLFYVDSIVDYFAQFAKDEGLKNFCLHVNPMKMDFIKLALVFAVTGRESEIAFGDDKELYRSYRRASAEHARVYSAAIGMSEKQQQRLARLVEYLGNPDFPEQINTSNAEDYQEDDNFMFHIMNLAHKLDLPRCYGIGQYQEALKKYCSADVVEVSNEQRKIFNDLIAYAINCIQITGDNLLCTMSNNGQLMANFVPRSNLFIEASTLPKQCEESLRQVPTPEFRRINNKGHHPGFAGVPQKQENSSLANGVDLVDAPVPLSYGMKCG